jgi:hypothetical protein
LQVESYELPTASPNWQSVFDIDSFLREHHLGLLEEAQRLQKRQSQSWRVGFESDFAFPNSLPFRQRCQTGNQVSTFVHPRRLPDGQKLPTTSLTTSDQNEITLDGQKVNFFFLLHSRGDGFLVEDKSEGLFPKRPSSVGFDRDIDKDRKTSMEIEKASKEFRTSESMHSGRPATIPTPHSENENRRPSE